MIALALLAIALAAWRAAVALGHFRAYRAVVDDPSIEELELINVFFEAGVALVLLVHAGVFLAFARRPPRIGWRYALGVALVCALWVSAAFLRVPLVGIPCVYPLGLALSVAVVSQFLAFDWLALYLGSVAGGALGCALAVPDATAFVCLFVVGPGVVWAFLGAALRLVWVRLAGAAARS